MELPSFEGCGAEIAVILAYAESDPVAPNVQRESRKHKQSGKKSANRVLMLGRLRELALYRAEVLRHHGFQVLLPDSEEDAIAAIREGGFDVAVLSYTLPDTAIQHFAELLRQHHPACPILAIAQTMRPDRRIEPDSVVLGDKGPAELVSALRRVLSQA